MKKRKENLIKINTITTERHNVIMEPAVAFQTSAEKDNTMFVKGTILFRLINVHDACALWDDRELTNDSLST